MFAAITMTPLRELMKWCACAPVLLVPSHKDDVYAFIFGQKGLMAGLGLQGSKITQIDP